MGISRKILENVGVTLIVALLVLGSTFLIGRYFGSDFESHYDIRYVKLPLPLVSPKIENSSVLTLFLSNPTAKTVKVSSIKVYGLDRFDGVRLFDFSDGAANFYDKLQTKISEEGVLTITNIPSFDFGRGRVLYVWGNFLADSVVITTDRGTYVSEYAITVSSIEKLFARNWKLNALIIAFVAFLSFYFGKLRKS